MCFNTWALQLSPPSVSTRGPSTFTPVCFNTGAFNFHPRFFQHGGPSTFTPGALQLFTPVSFNTGALQLSPPCLSTRGPFNFHTSVLSDGGACIHVISIPSTLIALLPQAEDQRPGRTSFLFPARFSFPGSGFAKNKNVGVLCRRHT